MGDSQKVSKSGKAEKSRPGRGEREKKSESLYVSAKNAIFTEFREELLFLGKESPILPYSRGLTERRQVKFPRLKLIMADLAFLTYYWDPQEIPKPTILYVGAAPGIHIELLDKLFADFDITWILYDPAEFKMEKSNKIDWITEKDKFIPKNRINIINDYFTEDDALKYQGRKDVFFISDVRSGGLKETTWDPKTFDRKYIIPDMLMQAQWVKTVKPIKASLKFRLPYYFPDDNMSRDFSYFPGTIVKELWIGARSTETRLVPSSYEFVTWDIQWYEQAMFYHNVIFRSDTIFFNPLKGKKSRVEIDAPEHLNSFDDTAHIFILMRYLEKITGSWDEKIVLALSRMIIREIGKQKKYEVSLDFFRTRKAAYFEKQKEEKRKQIEEKKKVSKKTVELAEED